MLSEINELSIASVFTIRFFQTIILTHTYYSRNSYKPNIPPGKSIHRGYYPHSFSPAGEKPRTKLHRFVLSLTSTSLKSLSSPTLTTPATLTNQTPLLVNQPIWV